MASGGRAIPGVKYPREVDASQYEGLPPGWKAIESAYLTGRYVGNTYVRFKGPISGTASICTVKKAIHCDAKKVKGLSDAEADKLAEDFEILQKAREEQKKKDREAAGYLKAEKREEAIAAFIAKYGQLDGATVTNLPGWEAKSVFRETCGQTAVTYYSPEGRPFCTVKDVMMVFGVQVLNGAEIPEIAIARSKLVTDEKGKVINSARQEINETVTAESALQAQNKRRRLRWDPTRYAESKSLAALQVPIAMDWSPTEIPREEAKKLQCDGAEIHAALVTDRHFPKTVTLLAMRGCESEPLKPALEGFFYMMTDAFNHRPVYQRIYKTSEGSMPLACHGVYIFWSNRRSRWTIGPLDDDDRAYAFAVTDAQEPTSVLRWKIFQESICMEMQD